MTDTVELLRALIQNKCVNDGTPTSGNESRSVATIVDYLGASGTVYEPLPGRQSVLYRVPGTEPGAPSLMLMGHTDVVPVTEAGWTRDPFGGQIAEGFVWGRGAIDMLNLTAAMAVVAKPFIQGEKRPLRGDLLYLAVADEEASGTHGAHYLTENHWGEVAVDFLLTEIAYPPVDFGGGRSYPVSVGEKGPFWTNIHSQGTPGHGSTPYGASNALEPLVGGLARLFETPQLVEITEIWRRLLTDWVSTHNWPPIWSTLTGSMMRSIESMFLIQGSPPTSMHVLT